MSIEEDRVYQIWKQYSRLVLIMQTYGAERFVVIFPSKKTEPKFLTTEVPIGVTCIC